MTMHGFEGRPTDRGRWRRRVGLVAYAMAVILVPLGVHTSEPTTTELPRPFPCVLEATPPVKTTAPEPVRALSGIWWRWSAGTTGDRVRFYYFHGDGTGLYRYGRVGLSHTHSFDYDVHGDRLELVFRKTGQRHTVRFSVEPGQGEGAPDWLELHDDPREPGPTRYFRESDAIVRADGPGPRLDALAFDPRRVSSVASRSSSPTADAPVALEPAASPRHDLGPVPAGHMWIDLQRYATGGQGFAMYQLRPAGIDGRGVGWFHRGDFDEWSTEALGYRIVGDRIELDFTLAATRSVTGFGVHTDAEDARWLTLDDDPRDYWHAHRYLDIGPSFGGGASSADDGATLAVAAPDAR